MVHGLANLKCSSCVYSFQETTELLPRTSRGYLILISYLLTTLNIFYIADRCIFLAVYAVLFNNSILAVGTLLYYCFIGMC